MENNQWKEVVHVKSSLEAKDGQFAMFVGSLATISFRSRRIVQ
jgi:hypothetical protein